MRKRSAQLGAVMVSLMSVAVSSVGYVAASSPDDTDGESSEAPTGEPYRVAMILGTSGTQGPQQQATVQGARAAANVLNAEGGILGRPVEIEVFDSQGDPARSVSLVQEEVLTQSWDLIYPGGGGAQTGPMLPFVQRSETLAIAPYLTPGVDGEEYPYFFSITPSPLDGAAAFADHVSTLDIDRLAIVYSSDAYGEGTAEAYAATVEEVGVEVVSESYDIGTADISPTLLRLQDEDPDLLFAVAFGAPAGHVLNSLDKLGWDVPLIGDLGMGLSPLDELAPAHTVEDLLIQTFAVQSWVAPEDRSPRLVTFLDAVKAEGEITQGLQVYGYGWDSIMLPAQATEIAGSTDAQDVAAVLETLDVPEEERRFVSYDNYTFSPGNHQIVATSADYGVVPYTPLTEGMIGKPD